MPRLQDVDFVAAQRPDLRLPQLACFGMNRQSQRIAMTQRKDLRLVARFVGERIILRRGSVFAKSNCGEESDTDNKSQQIEKPADVKLNELVEPRPVLET